MADAQKALVRQARLVARSKSFNIDNGAGVTVDDCILRHSKAVRLLNARIVYNDATTGTVAAATAQIGVAVAGATVVAATNLENTKAVGTVTAMVLLLNELAAGTPLIVRHTGIAITQAGEYYVEVEYAVHE